MHYTDTKLKRRIILILKMILWEYPFIKRFFLLRMLFVFKQDTMIQPALITDYHYMAINYRRLWSVDYSPQCTGVTYLYGSGNKLPMSNPILHFKDGFPQNFACKENTKYIIGNLLRLLPRLYRCYKLFVNRSFNEMTSYKITKSLYLIIWTYLWSHSSWFVLMSL